jgi:hypothetical protein
MYVCIYLFFFVISNGKKGDLQGAQRAFRAGDHDAIRAKNEYGETCMHLACQGGNLQVARWLYVAGAAEDVHALSNDGDTCMLLASLGNGGWSSISTYIPLFSLFLFFLVLSFSSFFFFSLYPFFLIFNQNNKIYIF